MNKSELRDAMAEGAGISKADAGRALDAFIDATSNALKGGERVALVGFGSFSVTHREARKGRNPQTGKEITIAAKNVVKFKPGAELNEEGQVILPTEDHNPRTAQRGSGIFFAPWMTATISSPRT